jgi:DNA-binding MarR family transcriptional regulator
MARDAAKFFVPWTPADRLDCLDKEYVMSDGIWMHCTNSAIRRAARQVGQLYDDAMGDTGLKGTQFSLLSQIDHDGRPALKRLAETMRMDLSALGHTLKPLIRDGLVELATDPADRRVKRVRLTAAGQAKQAELLERWKVAQARFDAVFGAEKSAEIREALAFISSPEFAEAFGKSGVEKPA